MFDLKRLSELGAYPAEVILLDTVAFISWYRDGTFLTVNPQFSTLTGYSFEELDRMRWPRDFTTPESTRHITKAVDDLDRENEGYSHDEELIRKDGSSVFVTVHVHKYKMAEMAEHFYYSFITDITGRKKSEERLSDAKAQADLFLDLMGHDINNLNQVAIGYIEMVRDRLANKGDRDLLNKSLDALMNTSRLIDNVKMIQREKAGLYRLTPIAMNKVLEEVIPVYTHVPGRDIEINYTPVECLVMGHGLVAQVFHNIIGNAVKHSSGPLVINIGVTRVRENNNAYCMVSIEDNGPGIPDDLKKKLFDKRCLIRIRATGRGLGLCLSRIVIDDLNGRIWVEDRVPGDHTKGTRLLVMLPMIEKRSLAAP